MKHFELKNFFGGAGGKKPKPPKPPTLKPPYLGDYKNIASYSYSEVIDLLSDGPIEGLTNKNGNVLQPKHYLQGVYLNDVPVESSDNDFFSSAQGPEGIILDSGNFFTGIIKNDVFRSLNKPCNKESCKERTVLKNTTVLSEIYYKQSFSTKTSRYWSQANYTKNININNIGAVDSFYNTINTNPELRYNYSGVTNPDRYYTLNPDPNCSFSSEVATFVDPPYNIYNYGKSHGTFPCSFFNRGTYRDAKQVETFIPAPTYYSQYNLPHWYKTDGNYRFEFFYSANIEQDPIRPYSWWGGPKFVFLDGKANILNQNKDWYCQKIDDGIGWLVETLTSTTSSNRYEKELIKEKLLGLNLDIGEMKRDFSYDVTQSQIEAVLEKDSELYYTQGSYTSEDYWDYARASRTLAPYLVLSIENEDFIVDGYVQEEHEDLFLNPKYGSIPLFDENVFYELGEIFNYEGRYYQIINTNGYKAADSEIWIISREFDGENDVNRILLDEPEVNWKASFQFKSTFEKPRFLDDVNWDFILPQLDENGKWNGKIKGFDIQFFKSSIKTYSPSRKMRKDQVGDFYSTLIGFDKSYMDYYSNVNGLGIGENTSIRSASLLANKFNYSNVLMEFRYGEEVQAPFNFFNNINIDHFYEDQLLGPFATQQFNPYLYSGYNNEGGEFGGVQKILPDTNLEKPNGGPDLNFDDNAIPDMDPNFLIAYEETSIDNRIGANANDGVLSYSDWDNARDFNEIAQPVTHIIENPNVKSCFISLWIRYLADTYENEFTSNDNKKIDAGQRKPGVLNIRVEVGLIKEDGTQEKYNDRFFQIIALIESPTLLDIGSPDSETSAEYYTDIRELSPFNDSNSLGGVIQDGLHTPFLLPEITQRTETDTEFKEDNTTKRYIKVTKLSTETESSLIKKDVDLLKVTEIIESTCTYPLSSLVGIKTDSRVFSEIPKRTYKCKLKKVKVPSNYFPLIENGKDKRYYTKVEDFDSSVIKDKLIYDGDWDGSFKIAWTDNPAWILYDMLTSPRYGLGEQIDESQVNKWDLYKIGRFCDAIDENGSFVGVSDGRGGLEPRFSCNILFSRGINVFDAINSISAIFRGIVYFDNSSISFSDDRLKEPIALFTNSNVKDGFFAYSSARRDEKYNAVEVSYKDKNDGYKSKIEYIENEDDIAKRGLFKKEIIAVGITSKAMAIRAAKHVMYQTTKEDETISFSTGTEALLCKPGDLITVEDELKTLNTNFGRVLSVDHLNGTIRTSEIFNASNYSQKITLYIPSGNKTVDEFESTARKSRARTDKFTIFGNTNEIDFDNNFEGDYGFYKYSKGYDIDEEGNLDGSLSGLITYQDYAIYTGNNISNPIIWFDTASTGWVFSTGKSFTNDNTYNKYITSGNIFNFNTLSAPDSDDQISGSSGWLYDSAQSNNRSSAEFSFGSVFSFGIDYFNGILEEEIEIFSPQQIRSFNVTGWGGYEGIQAKEYGDIIYIDQNDVNYNLLKFVPEGTTYRFQSQKYSDQVYKIQTIREEENHSYNIIANKYDSGKYSIIENEVNIEREEDVFGYNQLQYAVNDVTYITLDRPSLEVESAVTDDNVYQIILNWSDVENTTGYNLLINAPEGDLNINLKENNYTYDTDGSFGIYSAKVKALADPFNNNDYNTRYNNSQYELITIEAGDPSQIENNVPEGEGGGIE